MADKFVGRRGPPPIPSVQEARRQIDTANQTPEPKQRIFKEHRNIEWKNGRRVWRHLLGSRRRNRRGQSKGFGLYACRNCRWFYDVAGVVGKNRRIRKTCKEWGITEKDLPCPLKNTEYGFFEPLKHGREQQIPLDHLNPDELMILSFRANQLMHQRLLEKQQSIQKNQPVRFSWDGKILTGIVKNKSARRFLYIETSDGKEYMVQLGDLVDDPVDNKTAGGQFSASNSQANQDDTRKT